MEGNLEVRHWVHVWGQRWSVLFPDLERIVFSDQSDDEDLKEPLRNYRLLEGKQALDWGSGRAGDRRREMDGLAEEVGLLSR